VPAQHGLKWRDNERNLNPAMEQQRNLLVTATSVFGTPLMSLATPPATPWPLRTLPLEERRITTNSPPLRTSPRISCSHSLAEVQGDSFCKWLSSEQNEAVEYAASGCPLGDTLIVLRTGGGNSAVFLVPAGVRRLSERLRDCHSICCANI
jgi:superfamily II DNA helicase RecQ